MGGNMERKNFKLLIVICLSIAILIIFQSCSNDDNAPLSSEKLDKVYAELDDFIFNNTYYTEFIRSHCEIYEASISHSDLNFNIYCTNVTIRCNSDEYGTHYFSRPFIVIREGNLYTAGKAFENDWLKYSCHGEYIYVSNLPNPIEY